MYERMLNKQIKPTMDEFLAYCGETGDLFLELDRFMIDELGLEKQLRFPYGNQYGWGMKYSKKKKHICDIFAEKGAFTIMLRMSNQQYDQLYDTLSSYTQGLIDQKYPCGEGGYIRYRVLSKQYLNDIMRLLQLKVQPKKEK